MAAVAPAGWSRADLDLLVDDPLPPDRNRVSKPLFGSDFALRFESHLELARRGRVLLTPTLARGGLSNVWGATLLPYRAGDLVDWPLEVHDLAPYYEQVLDSLPVAAYDDELASRYPLFTSNSHAHPLGEQARSLLRDLRRSAAFLEREGIHFGASRLALRAGPGGCVACGHCLHGCPYGFIWSADHALEQLRACEHFEYRSGAFVVRVDDHMVEVRWDATDAVERITADRIFIAAGILGTAAIVLDSVRSNDVAVEIKDSQVFLLPTLQMHYHRSALRQEHVTLSEVFMDIDDSRVCPETVRLQFYGYSDSVRRGAARAHPRLFRLAGRAFEVGAPSLLTAFGYLHSRYSDSISVRLAGGARRPRLELERISNPAASEVLRRVASKLRAVRRQTRMSPLTPVMQMGAVGEGFHCGGTFPMREAPRDLETDRLGRLPAFDRVHIVDASVFPAIPAGPITLSAMANAFRIASEAWES